MPPKKAKAKKETSEVHIEGPGKLFSLDLKGEAARKWGGRVLLGMLLAAALAAAAWLVWFLPGKVLHGQNQTVEGISQLKKDLHDLNEKQSEDHAQVMEELLNLSDAQADQGLAYRSLDTRVANIEGSHGR